LPDPSPHFAPHTPRPHKDVLTAWLLLLLEEGDAHGWALLGALDARGLQIDHSVFYRKLHRLEQDGWCASSWTQPIAGPRRRVYMLTPQGHQALAELAARLEILRDAHVAFTRRHEEALARRDLPAIPEEAAQDSPPEAARPEEAPVTRPPRDLVAAWLLVLLDGGATYGYDLRRDFDAQQLDADPGGLYRMLRKLENDRWVQSRWMRPRAGPQRRFYRLTPRGRRNLDELAGVIALGRVHYDAFLLAYAARRA
jgi:PadR family transcriptional regulator PadR